EELDAWHVQAPLWGVAVPTWLESDRDRKSTRDALMVQAASGRRERLISFTRQGSYDTSTFDRVRVVASVDGGGGVGILVQLKRGNTVLSGLDAALFPSLRQLVVLEIALPRESLGGEPYDTLTLVCPGAKRTVAIREVQLLSAPPGAILPDPEGPAKLVRVGHEGRRSVGLLVGRDLACSTTVPPGARLDFSFGRPTEAWTAGGLEIAVDLSVDGESQRQQRWPVPEPDSWAGDDVQTGWRQVGLDLSDFAGQQVSFRFSAEGPAAAGLAMSEPQLTVADEAPPTILLITSDTHRGDHIGAAEEINGVVVFTPVLDALGERGTVFLDCFASVNNTNPSHVALFTGTHPRDTGVIDNYRSVNSAAQTLAERFAEAGWATMAAISTRHLGPDGSGLGQGFGRVSWPYGESHRESGTAVDDVLRWLPDVQGRPTFIWLHVFDPHVPYAPPAEHLARYYDQSVDPRAESWPDDGVPEVALPIELRGIRDLEYPLALYRAEITAQDEQLGRLLGETRVARGVTALVADHGESLGENGAWFAHLGVYTSTLHIPLVMAGPGVPQGVVERRPVQHLDLGRTLLDLAGLGSATFPGRTLFSPASAAAPRFALEAGGQSAALSIDGLHLVIHLADRDFANLLEPHKAHEIELFELSSDPRCLTDLADERPQEAARLRLRLLQWLDQAVPTGWAEDVETDKATMDALAQLGYVAPAEPAEGAGFFTADSCEHCSRWDAVLAR
ncbi:MAG: arylsulfatase, partial [Pseudohongiellaceae bacterium]